MNQRLTAFPLALFLAALLLAVAGCDIGGSNPGEEQWPLQTKILRVEVEPDTVAVGDTARFTAVIEDSTDSRFEFKWFLVGNPTAPTDTNTVLWEAEVSSGTYTHGVTVDNGTRNRPPSKQFEVTVVE